MSDPTYPVCSRCGRELQLAKMGGVGYDSCPKHPFAQQIYRTWRAPYPIIVDRNHLRHALRHITDNVHRARRAMVEARAERDAAENTRKALVRAILASPAVLLEPLRGALRAVQALPARELAYVTAILAKAPAPSEETVEGSIARYVAWSLLRALAYEPPNPDDVYRCNSCNEIIDPASGTCGCGRFEHDTSSTRTECEKLRAELTAARKTLSAAVGHNEPHETLDQCAALLVLDCDAENERALQAEQEVERLQDRARRVLRMSRSQTHRARAECVVARAECEKLRAVLDKLIVSCDRASVLGGLGQHCIRVGSFEELRESLMAARTLLEKHTNEAR